MAFGAGSNPGIRQLLAMRSPQFDSRPEGTSRLQGNIKACGILGWLLAAVEHGLHLIDPQTHNRRVARRILDHPFYVLMAGQHKGVAFSVQPLSGQSQNRRLGMEYGVGFIPMLLGSRPEQVNVGEGVRAAGGATIVVWGFIIHRSISVDYLDLGENRPYSLFRDYPLATVARDQWVLPMMDR